MGSSRSSHWRRVFDWVRDLQRRYSRIGGQVLAGGIALYGFLSLFALLVLGVAVLGFVSAGNDSLARDITSDLGLTGDAARIVVNSVDAARHSRRLTTVAGLGGIVWLGTGFALTIANAFDAAWGVPSRGLRDRAVGMVWLGGMAVLFSASAGATAAWALLPAVFAPLVIVFTLVANTALWLWTSWLLPNRRVALRSLVAPAIAAAVALEVLKVTGAYVVPHYVATSSELYGTIGVVFAILLWLLVFGRVVVYLAVLEASRAGVTDHRRGSTRS